MKPTTTLIANLILAAAFCIAPLAAQNKLSVVRSSLSTLDVLMDNQEVVGGIQFSVRSSSDVRLESLDRTDRTVGAEWIVASHRVNDSTYNVVILGQTQTAFSAGSGSLVRVRFTANDGATDLRATLANVMVAGPSADSLGVTIHGADWTTGPLAVGGSDMRRSSLGQNYPNPFNPSTRITYTLHDPGQVHLTVFDMTGREVNRLVEQFQNAGTYEIAWNSSAEGLRLASGTYFARLQVGDEVSIRKMTLMK